MTPDVAVEGLVGPVGDLMREAADKLILPRFARLGDHEIVEKTPGELVTIADRETEAFLTDALHSLLPGSQVVGEEACATAPALLDGMADGLVWIVDPLDGTANFASGQGAFGTIIALAAEGEIIAGWTFDSLADRLCFAAPGYGAHVSNGGRGFVRIGVPQAVEPTVASLATQFMPEPLRQSVLAAAAQDYDLRPIPRCAVEHYWRLCTGDNHLAMFQRTLPWDHAAGALIYAEAGGIVRRWNGDPYRFHDDGLGILAAASEMLWQEASERLLGDSIRSLPLVRS